MLLDKLAEPPVDDWQDARFPERSRILVIDDDPDVLDSLHRGLSVLGFEVDGARDGRTGIARYFAEGPFDLALVDLNMPDIDGIEVIRRLKAQHKDALAAVITAYDSIESVVQAMKAGAVDYFTKPVDLNHLDLVLNRILENRRQVERLRFLEGQVVQLASFQGLVGVSPEMQHLYEMIRKLANSNVTVLVQGETGTGKELVVRAIHSLGKRRRARFVPINCGAMPEALMESELFGHEKGAFTGAGKRKYGLIEQAENGTVFLDEIETLGLGPQVKLLRAIQEREVMRVGGGRPIPVDFRLIAATNVDLRKRMEEGLFREDLFYRINGVVVDVPPLRVRKGDIPLLADHFLTTLSEKDGCPVRELAPEAMMLLKAYSWPGNVRELENAMAQAVAFCEGKEITIEDLPESVVMSTTDQGDVSFHIGEGFYSLPLREARAQFERRYLREVLKKSGNRVVEAARHAGIHRRHLYEKMKQYHLSR